jgi:hypothetical protein
MTALNVETPVAGTTEARAGLLAALWACGALALLLLVSTQVQRDWAPPPRLDIIQGEQHYRLGPEQAAWLREFSRLHFAEGGEAARAVLERELAAGLEDVFDQARARLPAFADWYYSLQGEYSRLAMAAVSLVDPAASGFIGERAQALVFPRWEEDLASLEEALAATLDTGNEALRAGWLAELSERLAPYRVPAPTHVGEGAGAPRPLELETVAAGLVRQERDAFEARLGLSTVAAGAAGTVVWRASAGHAGARRIAGRGVARAGTAAGGAAAVCGPGGPAAIGCAFVAGAATWLATDWALLKLEEARHREQLIEVLEAGLAELQRQLLEQTMAAVDRQLARDRAQREREIELRFSPVQAGRLTN